MLGSSSDRPSALAELMGIIVNDGWRRPSVLIDELLRAKPAAAKGRYIRGITLTTTMGPGVHVDPSRTRGIVEELEEEPATVTA